MISLLNGILAGFSDQRDAGAKLDACPIPDFHHMTYEDRKEFDQIIIALESMGSSTYFAGYDIWNSSFPNNGESWTVLDNTGLPINTFVWSFIAADSGLLSERTTPWLRRT